MIKQYLYRALIVLIVVGFIVGLALFISKYTKVVDSTIPALTEKPVISKTKTGHTTVKVSNVQTSVKADNVIAKQIYKDAKDAGIKPKDLSSVIDVTIVAHSNGTSVITPSTVEQPLRSFSYEDSTYYITGLIDTNKVYVSPSCHHRTKIYSSLDYKGWWIFRHPVRAVTKFVLYNNTDSIVQVQVIDLNNNTKWQVRQ